MTDPKEEFSFEIRMGNPSSRKLLALKQDMDNLANGQVSVAFGEYTPQQIREMGPDNWQLSPQPYGAWISGKNGIPEAMLRVLQEFVSREKDIDEVSFTFADPEKNSGGLVLVTEQGYATVRIEDQAEELKTAARAALESGRPGAIPSL